MNGTGKSERFAGVNGLEDQAVFALTQLMTLYLDKNSFEKQRLANTRSAEGFLSRGDAIEVPPAPKDIPANTLGLLEHPVPAALKSGMRAIGTALYEKTKSTDAMSDVLYRVMERFPSRDQEVIGVLDQAFEGIGGWWS
jgi:hypothetical protein